MVDLVVILALVLVLGGAIAYVIREKKKGRKCIGCPYCDSCQSGKGGCKPSGKKGA